jgi:signal transduction histidine kinase
MLECMVDVRVERLPRPGRLDALLAVLSGAAAVAGSVAAAAGQVRIRPLDAFGVVLVMAAAAVAVGLRRVAPLWALAVTTLLVNAYVLAGYPYGPVLLCLVIAVFEVARQRPPATSAMACGFAAALSSATIFVRVVDDHHATGLLALAWTGWSVLPWSLGALNHVVHAARTRATRELIARTALEERMRIAGEVHDIAGHGFALITMQAQVALLVFEEQPEQARRSLEAVRDTGSTALADLRRMLDTFHPHPGPPVPVGSALELSAARRPADPAGVADLTELIDQVGASGLPVQLVIDEGCDLPQPVGATVYRVVQEALTNVLRHAGPTRALVAIERREGQMLVSVTDRGRGGSGTVGAPGRGLTGMRRRVEDLHGRLEAGPRDGGGFQVRAWLPLSEASA